MTQVVNREVTWQGWRCPVYGNVIDDLILVSSEPAGAAGAGVRVLQAEEAGRAMSLDAILEAVGLLVLVVVVILFRPSA